MAFRVLPAHLLFQLWTCSHCNMFTTEIKNFIIYKLSLGPSEIPQKFWAQSVQPFWRLFDTNKQTYKQTDKPNLQIDYYLPVKIHISGETGLWHNGLGPIRIGTRPTPCTGLSDMQHVPVWPFVPALVTHCMYWSDSLYRP